MSRFSNIRNPSYHNFQVGNFDCLVLSDGSLSVDMAGCYPGSDEKARNALLKYYGLPINPFSMDINTLLVDTGEHLVLIDTGLGETGLFGGTGGKLWQHLDERLPTDTPTIFQVLLMKPEPRALAGPTSRSVKPILTTGPMMPC